MNLRRTLSAAATATAIVPAVLLSATAVAHADPGPAGSTTAPSTSSTPSAPSTPPTADTSTPSSSAPTTSPSSSPTATPTDAGTPPPCSSGPSSTIRVQLKGLPSSIVAGGGWSTFTLNVAGTTDKALGAVEASVTANNGEDSYNADLYKHAYLEYWDAGNGKWLSLKDEGKDDIRETGLIYGHTTLKTAHASADLKFRIRVDAKATPGPSYAVGGGSYVDTTKNCTRGSTTDATFDVLAPGSKAGGSGTPAPSTAPDGGTLAETGSSSATPLIAGIGGAAVLVGAGAIGVVRLRRKGSAAV